MMADGSDAATRVFDLEADTLIDVSFHTTAGTAFALTGQDAFSLLVEVNRVRARLRKTCFASCGLL